MSEPTSAQPASPAAQPTEASNGAVDAPAKATTDAKPQNGNPSEGDAAPPMVEESEKSAKGSSDTAINKPGETGDIEMKGKDKSVDSAATSEAKPDGETQDTDASKPDRAVKPGGEEEGQAAAGDEAAAESTKDATATPSSKSKSHRKSVSASDNKQKKLNKKGSRARITHLDAKPGDYYFVKLKGYPKWPVIVCDESMLPETLLKTRPVTAARHDGTYREDYADGGKNAQYRTFPVMYLHTNEFGWVPNTDLVGLDPDTARQAINDKMRKDLQAAHKLAADAHPLQYYKDLLIQHQEDLLNDEQEKQQKQEKAAAKEQAKAEASAKKAKKAKDAEDEEMADAHDVETPAKDMKSKKRKAEDEAATPQRSESVKKPKIKLTTNSTPKPANGVSTPKSAKPVAEAKASKPKPKKLTKEPEEKKEKEPEEKKEPELTPAERHLRKEKEVLYLRHKLQRGLLTRDQEPKEEEMKTMSDYVTKLEMFPEIEPSIIRVTKINKVLKGILKLQNIPKESEFNFKKRSQVLLDKWNKLLAVDEAPAAGGLVSANGVNGAAGETPGKKGSSEKVKPEGANGVKENGESAKKSTTFKAEAPGTEETAGSDGDEKEKPAEKETKTTEAVQSTA